MKQTSSLTRRLAAAQEKHAAAILHSPFAAVRYTLFTEDVDWLAGLAVPGLLPELVGRYFKGATILYGDGLWQGTIERAACIIIIGTHADLQRVFDLAGDIRVKRGQSTVLVTWEPVLQFVVDEHAVNQSAL